jgi:hypothetical protein
MRLIVIVILALQIKRCAMARLDVIENAARGLVVVLINFKPDMTGNVYISMILLIALGHQCLSVI